MLVSLVHALYSLLNDLRMTHCRLCVLIAMLSCLFLRLHDDKLRQLQF